MSAGLVIDTGDAGLHDLVFLYIVVELMRKWDGCWSNYPERGYDEATIS